MFQEIPYHDPTDIFSLFSQQSGAILLDSAQLRKDCGRYSFIAIDPFLTMTSKNEHITLDNQTLSGNPFHILAEWLKKFSQNHVSDVVPFQGGIAGFFSYELAHHLEVLPRVKNDDMQFPDLAVGFYDLVIGFDEQAKRAWVFSNGFPEKSISQRKKRAELRMAWLLNEMNKIPAILPEFVTVFPERDITSNFTAEQYQQAVARVIQYILAGDIFEANISQRFKTSVPSSFHAYHLYRALRALNPAPFSAYLSLADTQLISASPERFLKLTQKFVETRPIKGTRPRGKNALEDQALAQELLASEKDRAENIMIVDLLRNDLSRVCENFSVQVPQLCGLETYPSVHHLVSVVQGQLKENVGAIDLLTAAFPGGSITGAPKIRAMEIITELEQTARGPYCGSIGYIDFNGDMDTSITIRTLAIKNNTITFQAGGAVVADSDPLAEYEETLVKSHALRQALTGVI